MTATKAKLLDTLPECVFLVDDRQTIVTANARAEYLVGVESRSITGLDVHKVFAAVVDYAGNPLDVAGAVERALQAGEAQLLDGWVENGPCAIDGEPAKVMISVLPTGRADNPATATIIVGFSGGVQPYRLRDAVLGMVSHELRTPLLHIKGFVSSLLESDIEWDEETRLDFLHTIDREADRLTSMVSDLMEISRIGSGDLPLHTEDVAPYMLVFGAVDSASPFAHRHRIVVKVPEDLPRIHVDVLRMNGVLVNLIQNATKYSEEGTSITINAGQSGDSIMFSVADEGVGIPGDSITRIFNMFYRIENGRKRSSGSGLGLAVCKAVVEAHRGEIWAESEPGKGSIFKFTVPIRLRIRRRTRDGSEAGS